MIGGGFAILVTLRNTVLNIKSDVIEMKLEIKKLADFNTRMAVADVRITNIEQDVHDMRHGRGFIQGERGVDRQYPS
jgi:hypothetical protein